MGGGKSLQTGDSQGVGEEKGNLRGKESEEGGRKPTPLVYGNRATYRERDRRKLTWPLVGTKQFQEKRMLDLGSGKAGK